MLIIINVGFTIKDKIRDNNRVFSALNQIYNMH